MDNILETTLTDIQETDGIVNALSDTLNAADNLEHGIVQDVADDKSCMGLIAAAVGLVGVGALAGHYIPKGWHWLSQYGKDIRDVRKSRKDAAKKAKIKAEAIDAEFNETEVKNEEAETENVEANTKTTNDKNKKK